MKKKKRKKPCKSLFVFYLIFNFQYMEKKLKLSHYDNAFQMKS